MIIKEFIRYGIVNVFSYAGTLLAIYLAVDVGKVDPRIAYLVIYTILYIIIYFANLLFVFKKDSSREKMYRFIAYSVLFLFLNNLFFNVLYYFEVYYFTAAVLSIVVMAPIKFLAQKIFVFK